MQLSSSSLGIIMKQDLLIHALYGEGMLLVWIQLRVTLNNFEGFFPGL